MNFIKTIFDKKGDSFTHLQFQKFSKGEFRNRALIRIKNTGEKFSIFTSAEFANDLVKIMAEKLGEGRTKVTGAIVSTSDLKKELEFKEIKQFQGVKKYIIDKEMSGKEILYLLSKFPKTFFALSFDAGRDNLKIKPKAPKSGKPGTKGEEEPKADFCSLKTTDKRIAQEFIFEKPNFKEAEIKHTFFIKELVIPNELKKSNDFAKIREEALRKGKIARYAKIDGQDMSQEFEFAI